MTGAFLEPAELRRNEGIRSLWPPKGGIPGRAELLDIVLPLYGLKKRPKRKVLEASCG